MSDNQVKTESLVHETNDKPNPVTSQETTENKGNDWFEILEHSSSARVIKSLF